MKNLITLVSMIFAVTLLHGCMSIQPEPREQIALRDGHNKASKSSSERSSSRSSSSSDSSDSSEY